MANLPVPDPQESHFSTIGERLVAKRLYNTPAMCEHLLTHVSKKTVKQRWCTVECAAHAFGMRVTEENRNLTRQRLSRAATVFLDKKLVLLKIRGKKHHELLAVKFFDSDSPEDHEIAEAQYRYAVKHREETKKRLATMAKIIGVKDDSNAKGGSDAPRQEGEVDGSDAPSAA